MKILYLAAIRLPTEKAHGLQIMKTCEGFAQSGAELELIVPARRNTVAEGAFEYYRVRPDFKIIKIKSTDFFALGRIGFATSIIFFAEAIRFMHEFWDADVIYSRDAFLLAQYVLLGRALVYEAHTAPTFISKFVARRAFRVVVISHGLGSAYEKAGVTKDKIIVAPDAIDLEDFSPERNGAESKEAARTRLGLPLEKKIALYIGRLDGWKGVETLFEAASYVSEDILVAVIGGEPAQVEMYKKKYPRVQFLGYRPYSELANNQMAADVLVLPNTAKSIDSSRYTSPLKLFTYMASGRPIVTADLPSIREVLDDESAFFFTPDDVKSLTHMISETFAHSEVASSKVLTAQRLVQNHTWKLRAQRILEGITRN